jgi:preprotein translocase subunit SecF
MARLTIIPDDTKIDFVGQRYVAFAIDGLLVLATIVSLYFQGLNLGIDFTGGVVIEASSEKTIDVGALREKLGGLGFGAVELQNFGTDKSVLIRVQPSKQVLGQEMAVAAKIKQALGAGFTIGRQEAVGPKVSGELFQTGVIATTLAILMIAAYVWFRFEWQFGIAGMLATGHDVLVAVGMYSFFQFDFNLTSIAALLLLAGYSINDTVVVFDRIRENRRKFRQMPLGELINVSTNQTLSRTFLTSFTTALSVVPLILFGGEALFGFGVTILWGIVVGTYSSIFVASCLLLYMPTIKSGQVRQQTSGAQV